MLDCQMEKAPCTNSLVKSGLPGELRHTLGASNVAKRGGDQGGVSLLESRLQVCRHIFFRLKMLCRIPRKSLRFGHLASPTALVPASWLCGCPRRIRSAASTATPTRAARARTSTPLRVPEITRLQEAYVAKVVATVGDQDHVLWDLEREPEGVGPLA